MDATEMQSRRPSEIPSKEQVIGQAAQQAELRHREKFPLKVQGVGMRNMLATSYQHNLYPT